MSTRPSTIEWQKQNWNRVKEHKLKWWYENRKSQLEKMRLHSKIYNTKIKVLGLIAKSGYIQSYE